MHTCRICNSTSEIHEQMFKYSTRHWAHYTCWLEHESAKLPCGQNKLTWHEVLGVLENGMHAWQLRNFPVYRLSRWLELRKVSFADLTIKGNTDKTMWLLKRAIETKETVTK